MVAGDWAVINETISQCLLRGVRRIVITHGTDTLAYSLTATAVAFGTHPAKICFTGSYYGLDHPNNDVELSLVAAMSAVADDDLADGVYATFRSGADNKTALLHHALRLRPMSADSTSFGSLYDDIAGRFDQESGWAFVNSTPPSADHFTIPGAETATYENLNDAARHFAIAIAYPGMDLRRFAPSEDEKLDALVVSLYHSGTGASGSEPGSILDFLKGPGKEIPVLLSPFPTRRIEVPYKSTLCLVNAGARLYEDLMPHQIYIFLAYGMACGLSTAQLLKALSHWQFHRERLLASAG